MKNAKPLITIRNDKEPSALAILGACLCGAILAVMVFHAI